MQAVRIKIRSQHKTSDGQENIEIISYGKLAEKNGKYYAMYDEDENTGLAGTKTTIKWDHNSVVVIRNGALEHRQEFVMGRVEKNVYITTGLEIPMITETKYLYVRQRENIWFLEIEYEILYGEDERNEIKMMIEIEEAEQGGYKEYTGTKH